MILGTSSSPACGGFGARVIVGKDFGEDGLGVEIGEKRIRRKAGRDVERSKGWMRQFGLAELRWA